MAKQKFRYKLTQSLAYSGIAITFALVLFAAGATVGYIISSGSSDGSDSASADSSEQADSAPTNWTCSMHPQILLPKPGKCPICFMDLIPLTNDDTGDDDNPRQLRMSQQAVSLAEIQTQPVRRQYATREIRLVGQVDYDETRVANITAWAPGRLDRLFVDFTGVAVRKGDHLVSMYSPDLIVAQRELIQAYNAHNRTGATSPQLTQSLLDSAEEKLRLLGVLPEQIEKIKRLGKPEDHITIYSPIGGIVIDKLANEGMYVQTGTKIYTIADLSQVWIYLDAYESDLPWLRYGQQVEFTTESYPGEIFKGRIAFIDPMLNEGSRTVRVRVNVPNPDGKLKPGMFIGSLVRSRLANDGKVFDPSLIGKWISPMHPEIVKDAPGKCDICGMDLVPASELGYEVPKKAPELPLLIPASAPLITGKRAVVYVQLPEKEQPTFEGREVLLGPRAGDWYIVRYGLNEGEQVVTHGNFKIDSALQIKARPSMMSPDTSSMAMSTGHQHDTTTGDIATTHDTHAVTVPASFRLLLTPIYESYLEATESLADDDFTKAKAALSQLAKTAGAIDTTSLDDVAKKRWKQLSDRVIFAALQSEDSEHRDDTRRHFADLSAAMIQLTSDFGHAIPGPLYRQHCPMAIDAQGADWLQTDQQVRNPYYGAAMLECGDMVASYQSQAPLEVPDAFRSQLSGLYESYLALQTALADDQLDNARNALHQLQKAIDEPDENLLKGRTLHAWQAAVTEMRNALEQAVASDKIEDIRQAFEPLSTTMLAVADDFGHIDQVAYYKAFCPMAFNNKGASWLQLGEQIANPYFGHQMLRCGEIQREFMPKNANTNDAKNDRQIDQLDESGEGGQQ